MREISLTQGKIALVDDTDFDWLNQWRWYANRLGGIYYVARNGSNPNRRKILMHRFILNVPKGLEIDHRDGDGLNNRRTNLRICTHQENQHNQQPQKNRSSAFKGVHWCASARKWVSRIKVDGIEKYLGCFTNELEAARIYDMATLRFHGEFARPNFSRGGKK